MDQENFYDTQAVMFHPGFNTLHPAIPTSLLLLKKEIIFVKVSSLTIVSGFNRRRYFPFASCIA